MSTTDLQKTMDALLKLVPEDGTSIGNKALMQKSGLSEDDYWKVRNRLIDEGAIGRDRGKGGSVFRILEEVAASRKRPKKSKRTIESKLYEPLRKTLENFWVPDNGIENYLIVQTAHQGKGQARGRWTRPDITLLAVKQYSYLPDKSLEVTTFEVKPACGYGVESVFETASHSVFAHRSILAIHLPDGIPSDDEFERIQMQCKIFGVGLVAFEDPADWESFDILVEPLRKSPDPGEVNTFIAQQIKKKEDVLDLIR